MKANNQKGSHGGGRVRLRVEFAEPKAMPVAIAGTFDDWQSKASHLIALVGSNWIKHPALPPGVYEYLLVVDGRWLPDARTKG